MGPRSRDTRMVRSACIGNGAGVQPAVVYNIYLLHMLPSRNECDQRRTVLFRVNPLHYERLSAGSAMLL